MPNSAYHVPSGYVTPNLPSSGQSSGRASGQACGRLTPVWMRSLPGTPGTPDVGRQSRKSPSWRLLPLMTVSLAVNFNALNTRLEQLNRAEQTPAGMFSPCSTTFLLLMISVLSSQLVMLAKHLHILVQSAKVVKVSCILVLLLVLRLTNVNSQRYQCCSPTYHAISTCR